jgi:DNA-directed RNA polymerase specialized sigma24 family protein
MSRRRAPLEPASPARARLIADFYAANARRLRATVAHRTHAPAEAVEDGCQTAWAILLRRPDVSLDGRGFGWLTVVAVREVRHQRDRARELPMGALTLGAGETGELPEPASMHAGVDELAAAHLEHVERVGDLSALKPAERTALYLQALGYRYREIASATDASYTAVNRRLTEGRARLRRVARDRADQLPSP